VRGDDVQPSSPSISFSNAPSIPPPSAFAPSREPHSRSCDLGPSGSRCAKIYPSDSQNVREHPTTQTCFASHR
jgi:hypothetical protein